MFYIIVILAGVFAMPAQAQSLRTNSLELGHLCHALTRLGVQTPTAFISWTLVVTTRR
jgi:hypothetical protein